MKIRYKKLPKFLLKNPTEKAMWKFANTKRGQKWAGFKNI